MTHPRRTPEAKTEPVVGLECRLTSTTVRVAVSDHDAQLPRLRRPGGTMEGGWGLNRLVRLAHGCGAQVLPEDRGKTSGRA